MRLIRIGVIAWLVVSEVALLQWLLLAFGWPLLGPLGLIAASLACVLLNFGLAGSLRRLSRLGKLGFAAGRAWMIGSLGALFSGPVLLLAFAVGAAGWLWARSEPALAPVARAGVLGGGGLAIAFGFGAVLWGWAVGQRRVSVERLALPLPGLPVALEGLRVAHITDLHIGPQLRAPLLERLVERVNALHPDLIVITGDIFDFDPIYIDEGCLELAKLSAPLGVFAILGNHDVYTGADAVAAGLARHTKIRVLRDEWVEVAQDEARLAIVGIEDPGTGWTERDSEHAALDDLAERVPAELPRLLLMHRPSWFRHAARAGFPLSLAGHTHGGQIAPPAPAQHHNVSRLIAHWTRGLFSSDEGDALLYVNRGIGVSGPPVRLNCTREIALIRLVRPPSASPGAPAMEPPIGSPD